MLEDRSFDTATSRLEVEWIFVGDTSETKHISMRLYSARELTALLRAAGFSAVRLLDASTDTPLRIGSRRALAIATK